jgi:MFS family permease
MIIGVFLFSVSLLLLEITFTRLSSVILSYHYVFLVLSTAMFGLGMGGLAAYYLADKPENGNKYLTASCALFVIFIPISIILMAWLPYISNIFFYAFLMFVPFFFAGVLLAVIFRLYPEESSRLYAADIFGAAAGVAAAFFLLREIGGINSALFASFSASVALIFFNMKNKKIILPAFLSSITIVIFIINLSLQFAKEVPVGDDPIKDLNRLIADPEKGGEIIETRWSAFGRTDLARHIKETDVMTLFIDGTAGTPMYRFNGDIKNPDGIVKEMPMTFPGYFPFLFLKDNEKESALIIGSGGGRDVLIALMAGIREITAVEVNRELVDIVKDYSKYNGGIYTNYKNVNIVVDEGRSFVKRSNHKYNSIILTLPVTKSSRSIEGFALTESFLLTEESVIDYLEHMKDDGQLIVLMHNKIMALRMVSLSLSAMKKIGIDNASAMRHIYLFGDKLPLFVLRKKAFTEDEIRLRIAEMQRLGFGDGIVFMPYNKINEHDSVNKALLLIADGAVSIEKIVKATDKDISAVTDESPFFYKFEKGLPDNVSLLLYLSIILSILIAVLPFIAAKKGGRNSRADFLKPVLLFLLLGAGFMILEVSLIQRFILFLGSPVVSMSVFLVTLFIGMSIGSFYSNRFSGNEIGYKIGIFSLMIGAAIILYSVLLSYFFGFLIGYEFIVKVIAAAMLVLPLGFLLGVPFPSGIRLLKQKEKGFLIPWMWGINGAASVLGSVLAVAAAIMAGFTSAQFISAGCYLFIGFLYLNRTDN